MNTLVSFPGLGLEMTINRVAFTLFGVDVYWYGLIIAVGLMVGIAIGYWKAKQFGIDADRMTDAILVTVVMAVLCARLYYVIFYPGDYDTLGKILNLRDGGLAIYGGVIGTVVFGWLMCRIRKIPVAAMFDVTAMGFLAGQGIGRWGNFFNQEAFGTNTTLPWGMYSERTRSYLQGVAAELASQGVAVDPSTPVHPTFLYESLWCLLGLVLLLCYCRHRRFDGEIALMYVMWYGAERCVVEGLRTDSLMIGPLRVSQVLAGGSCLLALVAWYILRRRARRIRAAGGSTLVVESIRAGEAAAARYAAAVENRRKAAERYNESAAQRAAAQACAEKEKSARLQKEAAARYAAAVKDRDAALKKTAAVRYENAVAVRETAMKKTVAAGAETTAPALDAVLAAEATDVAQVLDGKYWASVIKVEVRERVARLKAAGHPCRLAVLLVGDDPASAVYVRGKAKDCAECGIDSDVLRFPADVTEAELMREIYRLDDDPTVSGILVQLPLPAGLDAKKILRGIDPAKDVDGFTPTNTGLLNMGLECLEPCTPAGCMYLLQQSGVSPVGKNAVVIGRSNIVGKPMAALLCAQDATVTVCHSRTQGLAEICRRADILVAAVGKAGMVTADMVKPGAVVIDVGINRNAEGKLCGDVDYEAVRKVAGWITPVPGGVGLMTRAMLMKNTLQAAQLAAEKQNG